MKKIFAKIKVTNWPLWLQLFVSITLLFGLFIVLQQFVTNNMLKNFYIQTQATELKPKIESYEEQLQQDPFKAGYHLFNDKGIPSVILENNEIILSDYKYEITVDHVQINIPILYHDFAINDIVSVELANDTLVSITLNDNHFIYSQETPNTFINEKPITAINKPSNFNYFFLQNNSIKAELDYYINKKPRTYTIDENTKWYSNIGQTPSTTNLVFIHEFSDDKISFIIYSTQNVENVVANLNVYNTYVYISVMLITLISLWYISKYLAMPFENITYVANQLANLNFAATANEYKNRESTILTKSINKMSKSFQQTIEQLNTQNTEMKTLMDQQANQLIAKKHLVSSISHEIKTPLAIIQATVSGIIDGIFDEKEIPNELNNILKEINHSTEMLQEVLEVYKLDNDSFFLSIEKINLVLFTQRIINSFDHILETSNHVLNYKYDNDEIYISADYRQLKRAITNYIVNAIKHSPDNSPIDVNIIYSDNEVMFSVINYGITIPDEDLQNVFEPFYRVDKSGNRTERTTGSGLGLYLVKQIFEKHQFEFGLKNIDNGVNAYFIAPRIK